MEVLPQEEDNAWAGALAGRACPSSSCWEVRQRTMTVLLQLELRRAAANPSLFDRNHPFIVAAVQSASEFSQRQLAEDPDLQAMD